MLLLKGNVSTVELLDIANMNVERSDSKSVVIVMEIVVMEIAVMEVAVEVDVATTMEDTRMEIEEAIVVWEEVMALVVIITEEVERVAVIMTSTEMTKKINDRKVCIFGTKTRGPCLSLRN